MNAELDMRNAGLDGRQQRHESTSNEHGNNVNERGEATVRLVLESGVHAYLLRRVIGLRLQRGNAP
jgi:hypothetical protein